MFDYAGLSCFIFWATGYHTFAYLPLIYYFLQVPTIFPMVANFTFHAELLPHSEQVVFHKSNLFGSVRRVYVDIKNLEKVEAETVPSKNKCF